MPDIFNHNLLDDSGWETSDADPEIQKSKIKRCHLPIGRQVHFVSFIVIRLFVVCCRYCVFMASVFVIMLLCYS